ncbi:MAG TPA: ATP-binding protein [Gemmatimonadales bacterium]|nr:ATP-binding protein [Gemmatimonadales bacterium]
MLRSLSFRQRLTLRWTLSFGLVLGAAHAVVYVGARIYAYRDLDAQVRTLAATELASAVDEYTGVHLHDFPADSLSAGEYATKFAQLFDDQGRLLMQSPGLGASGPLLTREQIAATLRGEAPVVAVHVTGRSGRMAALRAQQNDRQYVLAAGLFADMLEKYLSRLAWLLAVVWAAGLAITGVVGYTLASRVLDPISRITARATGIARGDVRGRLDTPVADDEIGRMTRLLNEMLDRLYAVIDANRQFASDASHELRSPLTAMAGEVDVALKRERSAAEYRETLAWVREGLRDMTELTANLMVLVRAQERPAEAGLHEVPLQPLLEGAAERLRPLAAARGITIDTTQCPVLVAYGDERLLSRVVENVLANAVQYNRDGGSVHVTGSGEDRGGDEWVPSQVVLRIADTGPGIPEEEWERIFERFYRLDSSRSRRTGGSGLGLAICRAVVTVFGGSIRIAQSSDAGTTVEIRLPGRPA